MISQIAYTLILGKPVVFYMGVLTFLSLLTTASIGYLSFKGKLKISFMWHMRFAGTTIILALLHAILGLATYLNF